MSKRNKNRANMQRRPVQPKQADTAVEASAQSGANTTYYVHGPRGIHAQQADGDWSWMAQDGLGSVRSAVDNNTTVLQSVGYDPFGNPINPTGIDQTMYGYTGEPEDENGLVYLRERYLNPSIGSFLSLDRTEGNPDRSQSLNRYAYVEGNPINLTDPSGLAPRPKNPFAGRARMNQGYKVKSSPNRAVNPVGLLSTINAINSGCFYQVTPTANVSGSRVHVPCGSTPVNARSHPSFYGQVEGSFVAGTVFTVCEERADSPASDSGLNPASWVRVASDPAGCANSQLWIRRTDGSRNLLSDGEPSGCSSFPPVLGPVPVTTPDPYSFGTPGCVNAGTCLTGQESAEYQVAFILACEAGSMGYANFEEKRQAMVDIAYVIRSRMRSGGFPSTAIEVISQANAFQCYTEGASANILIDIAQAAPLAEVLVYGDRVGSLPPPSFPEIEYALFFFGLPWQTQTSSPANSIPRIDVVNYFTNASGLTSQPIVSAPASTLNGIYLGHGPVDTQRFTTFFFSDDPQFTGFIP
jgi:RHS repeat-associated protein